VLISASAVKTPAELPQSFRRAQGGGRCLQSAGRARGRAAPLLVHSWHRFRRARPSRVAMSSPSALRLAPCADGSGMVRLSARGESGARLSFFLLLPGAPLRLAVSSSASATCCGHEYMLVAAASSFSACPRCQGAVP